MTAPELRVSARGIRKSFGAVRALRGVNLDVRPGEIHALLGENGAGKSTLIKVLSGAIRPDEGDLRIDGQPFAPNKPGDALEAGVGTVYQDPQIVPGMSVAENIFLGRFLSRRTGTLRRQAMVDAARNLLSTLEISLDPRALCHDLSVADMQLLQVARAASFNTLRFLILDEPTSSLTPSEVRHLFGLVERLRSQGVSILFVSHKLEEVLEYADAITVFRDGEFIASHRSGEFTLDSMVKEMVGRNLDAAPAKNIPVATGEAMLSVTGLTGGRFHDISFDVRPGEIFGLFGLVGAGRTDVLRAIFGADRVASGSIRLEGKSYKPKDIGDAIRLGVALVPEDRRGQGLVGNLSVQENLTLATTNRHTKAGVLQRRSLGDITAEFIKKLGIKTAGPDAPVFSLSGGNQQKVVIARWLAAKPKLLMLDEPAAGIDIGAKADVYKLIEALTGDGTAIIVVSSELPEILRLSHRVGVMKDGHLVGIVDHTEATEERLLTLATLGELRPAGHSR